MWCPEGYYSWNQVLAELHETSERVFSLVCLGGRPVALENGNESLAHTAAFYLKSHGYADDYREAELIVSITTVFLMVNFLKVYPPVLESINGNKIVPEWPFICHKDQFENCQFYCQSNPAESFARFLNILD